VSATRQHSATGQESTLYFVNFMIPLGRTKPMTLTTNLSHSTDGRTVAQSTLTGSAGADNALSYAVTASHTQGGNSTTSTDGSLSAAYRTSMATLTSSVSAGVGYTQGSAGIRGAFVAHPGGVTLSQPISETISIVEALDAEGARVLNAAGVKVDSRGYAVVPFMTPYVLNTVDLDPKGLSIDVELQSTSQQVAPRAGSVTMLKFSTAMGRTAVIQASRADGEALPFGAPVYDDTGHELGVVGQASRIVARGLQDRGELTVRWGDAEDAVCHIHYVLPVREKGHKADVYQHIEATCEPPGTRTEPGPGAPQSTDTKAPEPLPAGRQ